METDPGSKLSICKQHNETVENIISGCHVFAKSEYVDKYDRESIYIHWAIFQHSNIKINKWYKEVPKNITDDDPATINRTCLFKLTKKSKLITQT